MNSKHLVICPYYEYERDCFILCEGVRKHFRWPKQMDDYMYRICDTDQWLSCEYARELSKAYEEGEHKVAETKINALKAEVRKLEKQLKKSEERNVLKDDELRRYRKRIQILEKMRMDNRDKEAKIHGELEAIGRLYESRLAYLMAVYSGGILDEAEMDAWCKDKEYAIKSETVGEDNKVRRWKVEVRTIGSNKNRDTNKTDNKKEQPKDCN